MVKKTEGKAKKEKKPLVVLLDVHAIIHRAYHALPDFTSAKGEPTGALYGLSTMLMKIIRDLEPDYIFACFDMAKPTFRHDVYKEYKAGRAKTDDNLVHQIKRSYDFFKAFHIPIYQAEGFEADDIIGTLAHKGEKHANIIIASGDMDTLQLVRGKNVRVFTLKKGINDTIIYDEEKVVERFGFKPQLLPDYKGLRGDPSDNIIGIKGIGEKTAEILIQNFGTLQNLYKILPKNEDALLKVGIKPRILELLKAGKEEALFSKVLAEIRIDAPVPFELPEKVWKETASAQSIIKLFDELGFRSLMARAEELFGEVAAKPAEEEEGPRPPEEEIEKIALALWVVDSSITNPTYEEVLRYVGAKDFAKAKKDILEKLKVGKLEKVYNEIELPLIPVLKKAEVYGVRVDAPFITNLSKKYHKELEGHEKKIWEYAGGEFNINSPKQLGEILFDKLNLGGAKVKKTAGGAKSTRAEELEKMRDAHPIINELLVYRELQKLLSTYLDNLPDMVGADGRLHTHFVQTGAATGRMASQNPNLQNIPIRSERGKELRKMFVVDKGYKLVTVDYSQIELRIAALLSGDEKLQKVLTEGGDVHRSTAALIFRKKPEEVTSDMRRAAKVINFGIIYGMGVTALQKNLQTTRAEAQEFYNQYFETFSGLATYLENVKKEAKKNGFTETYFGRRRYFPGLRSNIPFIVAAEERQAANAPIQGTVADMMKIAMVSIDKYLPTKGLADKVHLLLQIHDELMYEVKEDAVDDAIAFIKHEMEKVITEVPIKVDAKVGDNWGEMESYT
jgi:DNA polymerase-1